MTIISDMRFLHPKFQGAAADMQQHLIHAYKTGLTKTRFEVFETFRTPMRQAELIAKRVTKAGPYQSAHQFGLAVDFVPVIDGATANIFAEKSGEKVLPGWNWLRYNEWDYLTEVAQRFGFRTLSWDRPHVEHPDFAQGLRCLGAMTHMP